MKLGVLYSGGKDSTYAIYLAKKLGYDISCLITIYSKNKDSYMYHTPNIELTKLQSISMKIPQIFIKTKGEKEKELKELEIAIKKAISKYSIRGVLTGAVDSVYQSTRIQKICNKLDIECFNPLWQKDQLELLEDLNKNNFEVIISSIAAYPLTEDYLGKRIDRKMIDKFVELNRKSGFNLAAEGGEFESFVKFCPLFNKKIIIKKAEKIMENEFTGKYIIKKAKLEPKG